jgi:hypothetical protein
VKVVDPEHIGSYQQPLWTTQRRFLETRAYVIPEGDFEFEYWNIVESERNKVTLTTQKYEAEIGLGNRLQLDVYAISDGINNKQHYFAFDEHDVEVRYAFADWNKIPGNPTAYAEYKFLNGQPDHVEFKGLFSGDLKVCGKNLDWAANGVWEHQMGAHFGNTYEATGGVAYELNSKISAGVETKIELDDTILHRFRFQTPTVLIGPSVQFTPLKNLHIDFTPEVGVTHNSPELKTLLIFGWKF